MRITAPEQASATTSPLASAARAANWVTVDSACCLAFAGTRRMPGHRRMADRAQRRSDRHPCQRSAPTLHGLTRARTRTPGCRECAHSPSASAMATAPYSTCRSSPLGALVTIAPQCRHRYRRRCNVSTSGGPSAVPGPSICLTRIPCPTNPKRPPSGAPGASQQGHTRGLTSSMFGAACAQSLTSPSKYAMR